MCVLCGGRLNHFASRRSFLKGAAATGVAASALSLFDARPARAQDDSDPPRESGRPGRRILIRGGSIMSMDPAVPTSSAATC